MKHCCVQKIIKIKLKFFLNNYRFFGNSLFLVLIMCVNCEYEFFLCLSLSSKVMLINIRDYKVISMFYFIHKSKNSCE